MNKSLLTNSLSAVLVMVGCLLPEPWRATVLNVGLYALSGGVTNWLAIHMLFEKVPFLYGSGVIPDRFEDFKTGIHALMMRQFFTLENIERFFDTHGSQGDLPGFDFAPVIEQLDLDPAFDRLVETIQESRFGGMLGMFGGVAALEPMRGPFAEKLKGAFIEISHSDSFQECIHEQLAKGEVSREILEKVDVIVTRRLEELTPQMVKEIVQDMIRQHLGWLVVWGGVFGGLIGLVVSLLT